VQDWYPENPGSRTDRIIVPLAQVELRRLYVSVRTYGDAAATAISLPGAVARVDPDLPVEMPQTLGSFVSWLQRMPRTIAAFGVLGGLAGVLVTGIGLYGVMAFQVRIRLREIGVRMAVGANRLHILREIMRETLVRIAPGFLAGMVPAVYVARYLGSMLAAAGAPTLVLLAGVVMTLLMVGILAALRPALRATRLDPMQVLRQ
jgi:hypothetical protein